MNQQKSYISLFTIFPISTLLLLSGCGGGGTTETNSTNQSTTSNSAISLGTYKGQATTIVQEQSGYSTNQLNVTCTLQTPKEVNSYEKESNPFSLNCGTDNQLTSAAFAINSANISTNQTTFKKLLVQYWNISLSTDGFNGNLVSVNNPVANNFFIGRNYIYDQYVFNEQQASLSAKYYPSSASLEIKIIGQGRVVYGTTPASFEANIMLTKSY